MICRHPFPLYGGVAPSLMPGSAQQYTPHPPAAHLWCEVGAPLELTLGTLIFFAVPVHVRCIYARGATAILVDTPVLSSANIRAAWPVSHSSADLHSATWQCTVYLYYPKLAAHPFENPILRVGGSPIKKHTTLTQNCRSGLRSSPLPHGIAVPAWNRRQSHTESQLCPGIGDSPTQNRRSGLGSAAVPHGIAALA